MVNLCDVDCGLVFFCCGNYIPGATISVFCHNGRSLLFSAFGVTVFCPDFWSAVHVLLCTALDSLYWPLPDVAPCCPHVKLAVFYPFEADQAVGKLSDFTTHSLHDDKFEAIVLIYVYVHG